MFVVPENNLFDYRKLRYLALNYADLAADAGLIQRRRHSLQPLRLSEKVYSITFVDNSVLTEGDYLRHTEIRLVIGSRVYPVLRRGYGSLLPELPLPPIPDYPCLIPRQRRLRP